MRAAELQMSIAVIQERAVGNFSVGWLSRARGLRLGGKDHSKRSSAMAVNDSPVIFEIVKTESGRLRVDIPATRVEAEDPETLLAEIAKRLAGLSAAAELLRHDFEEAALRRIEQLSPRREALEKLARSHPPSQDWYSEPEWADEPE
jgi:hypothetical protein